MKLVETGDLVKVHYTGTFEDGKIFDSSEKKEPLSFKVGDGSMISGFCKAVLGMKIDDTKKVKIMPEEAYGPYMKDKVFMVDRNVFPENFEIKEGLRIQIQNEEGQTIQATISSFTDWMVVLDANHPLAGKIIVFEIKVVGIG